MKDNPVTGKIPTVAYFCMEFGLHEDFKIYSGGLGILAGDILKAARDENYPMVGVGILWRQGYTRQLIDRNGLVYDSFYEYRYDFLEDTGTTVQVRIRGRQVKCKIWKCACFQNVPLYLLDTNLPENEDRLLTGQLYGWFSEERVAQEMILGIGGIRALKELGLKIDCYHFNDSHPVLAGIELIREKIESQGYSFAEALEETKKQIVFTTHTPVKAGNEVHEHELLRYMGAYNGLTFGEMLKLGGEPFSMTVAGMRLAKRVNAVAQLHARTANKMWSSVQGVPRIIGITNGVHNGTWQDPELARAYRRGADLWAPHLAAKRRLLQEVLLRNGVKLKEEVLTIGFARRQVPYKRGDLIFRKPEVIDSLLRKGRLQLLFAGKTHPNDLEGKKIISHLYRMTTVYPESVVFLEDYDMKLGRLMTSGCDLWLNNPRRPKEASGTSGMKAAMNGVLNFSVLDGWWPEGYQPGLTGWQIGDGYEGPEQDKVDTESLYQVLLTEIIPTYYERREKWQEMMRVSIEMAEERFSAARMLRDYYEQLYKIKEAPK
ncbi:MAG TPA: alpha-glucan family phosphorylase [Firmicutes bacterium]|jgi:starch phosphorylase|nr:alpha-glucan family phosphorylase [Bacillota bacterium]